MSILWSCLDPCKYGYFHASYRGFLLAGTDFIEMEEI